MPNILYESYNEFQGSYFFNLLTAIAETILKKKATG